MKDADIKKYIKQVAKEVGTDIKRQMGAYKEEMHGYVKAVAEQHLGLNEKIDKMQGEINNLAYDVKDIKSKMANVEYTMNVSFERKADKKLFVDLDNRVQKLEHKR
ncbi:MAG TPA: hypothetical protein VJB58_00335 [Candidatus Paceibacterota bacterium]